MPPTVRLGELSSSSLRDALAFERTAGARPTMLAVGSRELFERAVNVLRPPAGGLGDLSGSIPNVKLDEDGLPPLGWELR